MPWVNHNGVRLQFEVHGKGRTLLLTHDFLGAMDSWDAQVGPLSRHCKVIRWDMRGHGQSDYPESPDVYTERMFLADMRAVLAAADSRSAVLVGHGLGANLSLAFAIAYPRWVRGLILSSPEVPCQAGMPGRNETAGPALADYYSARGFVTSGSLPPDPVLIRRHRHPWGLSCTARTVLGAKDSLLKGRLKEISVPTLVMTVDEIDTYQDQVIACLLTHVPQAKMAPLLERGHYINGTGAAPFNAAIAEFLADHRQASGRHGIISRHIGEGRV